MKIIFKKILGILKHGERSRMIQLILLDTVISLLDIAFLAALIYVIHFYTAPDQAVSPSFFPFTFFSRYPLSLIISFFLLFALKNGLGYLVFKMQFRFVYAVASRLSKNNLLYFLQGNYDTHVHIDSAAHIREISEHPIQFGHYILGGVQQIVGQTILILFTIAAILIFSPLLFLLLFIILTPPVIFIGLLIKRRLNAIRKTAKPVSEKTLQHLQEALAGYIESNIFQRSSFFVDRYSMYQAKFNDFLSQQLVVQNLPSRFMEVFALFGLLILIVLNFYGNNSSSIQLVTLGTFMAAAYKIIPGIVKILNSIGQIKTYGYTITDLSKHQAIKEEINEQFDTTIRTIVLANICFTYKEEKLLNDLSLEMNKGDFIGLTGISGKGKTTLINLILGFLNQHTGNILINNKIASVTDRQRYCKNIAYVKQDLFLIHDTILSNITLEENVEDNYALENAVKATGLDILTSTYREGLNKLISENGRNISGGQRQRIVIARALYKKADLIILDEPFNELDRESENKLLEHFRSLAAAGKIIILVTHNKESLSFCDKIISLDEA